MDNTAKIAKIITALAEYYSVELNSISLRVYVDALKHIDPKKIEETSRKLIQTNKFMPKVSDFLATIDDSLEALLHLEEARRKISPNYSIDLGNPALHATINALGGWPLIAELDDQSWQIKKRDFDKLYSHFKSQPKNSLPTYLPGIFETQGFTTSGFTFARFTQTGEYSLEKTSRMRQNQLSPQGKYETLTPPQKSNTAHSRPVLRLGRFSYTPISLDAEDDAFWHVTLERLDNPNETNTRSNNNATYRYAIPKYPTNNSYSPDNPPKFISYLRHMANHSQ